MTSSYNYAIVFLFILFFAKFSFSKENPLPADPPSKNQNQRLSHSSIRSKEYIVSEGKRSKNSLKLKKTIEGNIRPKSIVHSGDGLFFAQNMMYRHSITVYNRSFEKIKTIIDKVNLSDYDLPDYQGEAEGSPVEVAFSPDKKIAWVSNYKMYGDQFKNPGQDNCFTSPDFDQSFIYKVNTQTLQIESLIEVGCVPKYVATTPDNKFVLVTNWCSGDLSIIDVKREKEIERIPLGRYPRGIVVEPKSRYAYISIMGSDKIAVLKLADFSLSWISNVGKTPRHLCISPSGRYLYSTLSREGKIAKIDLIKGTVVKTIETGKEARSMVITPGGNFLYVVNYEDNTVSKVDAEAMTVLSKVETNEKPIGITFDAENKNVWVACYSGSIMIFEDQEYHSPIPKQIDPSQAGPLPPSDDFNSKFSLTSPIPKKDNTYFIYKNNQGKANKSLTDIDGPLFEDENLKDINTNKSTRSKDVNKKPKREFEKRNLGELDKTKKDKKYHLVVGSYENHANAIVRQKKLKLNGFQPSIIPVMNGTFRVSCAFYDSRGEADTAKVKLKEKHGIEAWILVE